MMLKRSHWIYYVWRGSCR